MGCYIQVPEPKAVALIKHGAEPYSGSWKDIPKGKITVCVVDNGSFEAAGVCYDEQEFREFTDPDDPRPRILVILDLAKALELEPDLQGYLDRVG